MAKRNGGIRLVTSIVVVIILGVTGIYALDRRSDKSPVPEVPARDIELSAWLVDWQWKSGLEDMRDMADGLTSVQAFAAYFDETDSLYFTEKSLEAFPEIMKVSKRGSLVQVDLTIVNDRINQDGSEVQKDSSIVTRLMATEESRANHINEIMDTVTDCDFHGVEIDYERVEDDDWSNLILFYSALFERLNEQGKTLRIVLEPRTLIEELKLPEGPAYVIMAYNLYGTTTGPGPKADNTFIAELAERLDQLPGNNFIALAAGGFDWMDSGKVTAVTEKQAMELSQLSLNPPKRDTASGSMYFDYLDSDAVKHTVWYADEVTLTAWIDVAQQAGYDRIAIWRLGGLGEKSLRELNGDSN